MKKYFSLASALMLALCMGMTSCSSDLDEVQAPAEQQTELKKLYLTATAPNSPETRAYVSGTTESDAITISGWKDGDKIYGIYRTTDDEPGKVEFTFNGSTNEFESESTSVTNDQITYFVHGNIASIDGTYSETYFDAMVYFTQPFLTVDLENNFTNLPLYGAACVDGGKLTANMQLAKNMAFVCLHNNTSSDINVKLIMSNGTTSNYVRSSRFKMSPSGNNFDFQYNFMSGETAEKTIPANGKAYLPIETGSLYTYKVVVDSNIFKEKPQSEFVAGKVYKLFYPAAPAADPHLLPGSFSVSDTKKVKFTKSNLYWNGSAWKFEAKPTDYPTTKDTEHIGHFLWTKTAANSYAESYSDGTNTDSDKFFADGSDDSHKLTVEGISNLYVLSGDEWSYLLNTRTNASSLFKYGVTVNDGTNNVTHCHIIAPDTYDFSGDNALKATYTLTELEEKGLVCLPAAGYLESTVENHGTSSFYWSSTPHWTSGAYYLYYNSLGSGPYVDDNSRENRYSIRAVLSE